MAVSAAAIIIISSSSSNSNTSTTPFKLPQLLLPFALLFTPSAMFPSIQPYKPSAGLTCCSCRTSCLSCCDSTSTPASSACASTSWSPACDESNKKTAACSACRSVNMLHFRYTSTSSRLRQPSLLQVPLVSCQRPNAGQQHLLLVSPSGCSFHTSTSSFRHLSFDAPYKAFSTHCTLRSHSKQSVLKSLTWSPASSCSFHTSAWSPSHLPLGVPPQQPPL